MMEEEFQGLESTQGCEARCLLFVRLAFCFEGNGKPLEVLTREVLRSDV